MPGHKMQGLLKEGKFLHVSVAVKGNHCCAALESVFEPYGVYFVQLAPAVSQIYPTSLVTAVLPWLPSARLSQLEKSRSVSQGNLVNPNAFSLVYCHFTTF